jgi:hypothetical protein
LEFKQRVENETGQSIITLRTDKGGEYYSRELINYCIENIIQRQIAMANMPQQNGISKRQNRTIGKKARSMAATSKCPSFLWS